MAELTTVYVSIGNSDDNLTQREWSEYSRRVEAIVADLAEQVYGVWHSEPGSPFQNACVAAAIPVDLVAEVRSELTGLRAAYRQDSVAWAEVPKTEFI